MSRSMRFGGANCKENQCKVTADRQTGLSCLSTIGSVLCNEIYEDAMFKMNKNKRLPEQIFTIVMWCIAAAIYEKKHGAYTLCG